MIFNLFKSKPTLKELIPKGFVDIHSHILPGIDDGAQNTEDSLVLISEMRKLGFSKVIGTPHTYAGLYENTNQTILESYNHLSSNINCGLKLDYASEYLIDDSILNKIQEKSLLCLKNNLVLVELSYLAPAQNLFEIIFELKVNGYIPILAHPERYRYFYGNSLKKYEKLKKVGCKFQLNLLSTTNHYGNDICITSEKLLKNNMIDFVGSDIHNTRDIKSFDKKINVSSLDKLKMAMEQNKKFD